MKQFHITIKDNETGEIAHDYDTDCIIGAFLEGDGEDKGCYLIGCVSCNANELLNTISSAERAIEHLYEKHPELLFAKVIYDAANSKTEKSE